MTQAMFTSDSLIAFRWWIHS